jgi:Xaa-Pro aminopeptidase
MEEFATRRNKLAALMRPESIMLLPGAKIKYRNNDSEYPFRQNSDFYYLTGFCEPKCVMAICKDAKENVAFILFNQANDALMETWTGKRVGIEGVCKAYGANEAHDIANIDNVVPKLFANKQTIYYPLGSEKEFDLKVIAWLDAAKRNLHSKTRDNESVVSYVPDTLTDVLPLIHELRLFKSEQEIALLRRAAEISAQGHLKLMQTCKPGQMEYQLEAIFNEHCFQAGCRALAYNTIVAGGNNGCTLHYVTNDQPLKAGDLVLVDAGGEFNYYAADITRTFPVSGKFSPEQKQIYNLVLQAQLAGIEQVKPGNPCDRVQEVMVEIIVNGLLRLGVLSGNAQQIIKDKDYLKFYMHSSGHWLGLDVHDAGKNKANGSYRKFAQGMVVTVEPGIYINNTTQGIDRKWLGIAVRIEDDVLVTKSGNDVLSCKAPKTVDEIESARL